MAKRFARTLILASLLASSAHAAELVVPVSLIGSIGPIEQIGTVTIAESGNGLVFTPNLDGLAPGIHGFHIHEHPSCQPAKKDETMVTGLAAGGHYDPTNAKHHGAPWGDGHLGDLPGLVVSQDGRATYPVLAPRLKLGDIEGRALMIHAGGDNYSDQPAALGGGGARIACGVIGG